MRPILFWKTWTTLYQRLFWVCSTFLIVALVSLWISNLRSPAPVLTAEHFQELEPQEIPVHVFHQGTTPVTISAENYLLFDRVLGGDLQPNLQASYLFLALLLTGIIILLSVLTTMTRFWFYMGMGLFILFVVSFRLEALELFGLSNKLPIVIILLVYGLAGYYFQFLRPSESFIKRIAVFLIITLVIGTAIVFFARINQPLYYLSANGLIAGTILTILFIFTIAHEIIASFVFVITRGKKPTRSLQHFLIISAIYLINLGLIFAAKKHFIEWNFFPVSLFLLLTLSGILGLWGFRQREPLYESIMRADPFGTYFFMALAGIGFGTIGYFLATANDPVIQIMQDAILYSHLGYGIIFVAYIITNFISLLGANLQVHKVLYKPSTMRYFTFRFAGLIATFTFFAYSNWQVSVNQVYAGYYNALGDFYLSQDTLLPAEGYYQRSLYYATRNYHAHYAVAELEASRWNFKKEKEELQRLVDGRPLDLAYLNYSRIYELSDSWRESVQVLKMGLQDFPKNSLLQNALGLSYAKLENEDSALLLINAARNSSISKPEAETNLMGLSARFQVAFPVDSLVALLNSGNRGVMCNALALASLQGKALQVNVDPGTDTVLTALSAATLNNYLLNHLTEVDTAMVSKTVWLGRRPSNSDFKNILVSAAAHVYYQSGEITKAFKLMHEVAFMGQQPKDYNTLGLWCLEQGVSQTAIHFFDQALLKNFKRAYFNRALALTEAHDFPHALSAWDSLMKSPDVSIKKEVKKIKSLLIISPQEALLLGDKEKYDFSRYRFSLQQEDDFVKFIQGISDQGIKARAIVDRCRKWEEADVPEQVLKTLNLAKGLQFHDRDLYEEVLHLNLRCIAKQKQWPLLEQQLHSTIHFDGMYHQEKVYFEALLDEQAGKKDEAGKKFDWIASVNPFFEDALVAASTFAAENAEDKLKAYTILVNALDMNPTSVKLLKAYFVQAALLDFDDSAKETLDKLHTLLSREAFIKFAKENPDIFDITQN